MVSYRIASLVLTLFLLVNLSLSVNGNFNFEDDDNFNEFLSEVKGLTFKFLSDHRMILDTFGKFKYIFDTGNTPSNSDLKLLSPLLSQKVIDDFLKYTSGLEILIREYFGHLDLADLISALLPQDFATQLQLQKYLNVSPDDGNGLNDSPIMNIKYWEKKLSKSTTFFPGTDIKLPGCISLGAEIGILNEDKEHMTLLNNGYALQQTYEGMGEIQFGLKIKSKFRAFDYGKTIERNETYGHMQNVYYEINELDYSPLSTMLQQPVRILFTDLKFTVDKDQVDWKEETSIVRFVKIPLVREKNVMSYVVEETRGSLVAEKSNTHRMYTHKKSTCSPLSTIISSDILISIGEERNKLTGKVTTSIEEDSLDYDINLGDKKIKAVYPGKEDTGKYRIDIGDSFSTKINGHIGTGEDEIGYVDSNKLVNSFLRAKDMMRMMV